MRHMRKYLGYLLKVCISGVLAIIILSLFSLVYFNRPMVTPQDNKYTNFTYRSNRYWSDMTEGWGFGNTNSLGYIDTDYSVPENPDIIFLGSSHTEALQVPAAQNFVSLTERLLEADATSLNNYSCLNLGVSGHTFATQISNLPYIAENFDGMKYVVIETSNFNYSTSEFDKMLSGEFHTETSEKGALYQLAQNIPYFRLLANQYLGTQNRAEATETTSTYDRQAYTDAFGEVAEFVSAVAKEEGFQVIFLYHTRPAIGNGNNSLPDYIDEQLAIVQSICSANGIYLVNTYSLFNEHFEQTFEHPYGFSNTQPGFGHLNRTGHQLIAEALYDAILKIEEAN